MNIPEGFVLVPASMLLGKEVIELVAGHCGDGDQMFGDYTDGRLWVGDLEGDDGEKTHGLHVMTDEYPEEGSSTLVEFPRVELPAYDEAKEPFGYHYSFARVVRSDGPANWVNEFDREKPAEFHFEDGRVKDFTPLYTRPSAVFDEASELAACRAHWEKNPNCLFSDMWLGWKACAQSRDGSVSDE